MLVQHLWRCRAKFKKTEAFTSPLSRLRDRSLRLCSLLELRERSRRRLPLLRLRLRLRERRSRFTLTSSLISRPF
jgi:hypothetical protein